MAITKLELFREQCLGMPLGITKLRQPTVTILSPAPPERRSRPQRVHFEIVDRRAPQPSGHRFGTLTVLLVGLVLAGALL